MILLVLSVLDPKFKKKNNNPTFVDHMCVHDAEPPFKCPLCNLGLEIQAKEEKRKLYEQNYIVA